jgi:hypothetical protein
MALQYSQPPGRLRCNWVSSSPRACSTCSELGKAGWGSSHELAPRQAHAELQYTVWRSMRPCRVSVLIEIPKFETYYYDSVLGLVDNRSPRTLRHASHCCPDRDRVGRQRQDRRAEGSPRSSGRGTVDPSPPLPHPGRPPPRACMHARKKSWQLFNCRTCTYRSRAQTCTHLIQHDPKIATCMRAMEVLADKSSCFLNLLVS